MTLCWPRQGSSFSRRHIGPDAHEQAVMLKSLGLANMDELMARVIPETIRDDSGREESGCGVSGSDEGRLACEGLTEEETLSRLRQMADRNKVMVSMIGQGYYDTFLPSVILRNVLENPAWYTAYTPYQPEISQGRLEALLNFQTLVSDLTGFDIANASLLDESTACAEAMAMARRIFPDKKPRFFVDEDIHPQHLAVMQTRARPQGWEIVTGDPECDFVPEDCFGLLLSYPGSSGMIGDFRKVVEAAAQKECVVTMLCDPMALLLLEPPSAFGADIAVGSMQRYGTPMGNGGPHAAFMACRESHKRHLPGRIIGISRDRNGNPALRLALQTREQHIRRERATSNICTAQALPAMLSAFYALYHGPDGLDAIARRIHGLACILAAGLQTLGVTVLTGHFFDTITVELDVEEGAALRIRAERAGINLRFHDSRDGQMTNGEAGARIGISCDETTTPEMICTLWQCFGASGSDITRLEEELTLELACKGRIPEVLQRREKPLQQGIFCRCHSETQMMRYLRSLADKDLALDRSMIPLGSCTMKLNPATAMLPVTWPEFGRIHPFAPEEQKQGYAWLYRFLEEALCEISGYDAVSLQPNSGAQGEFAGLMAISAWHRAQGQGERDLCLIPASAHGTNPASAQMAGMQVCVVACDKSGNVDIEDLRAKLAQHGDRLAAIMVTYPSTHGVFEEHITEICRLVHESGGQVYLDGANMNAQLGLARPGQYGADVSHFNLHKTFCIPHGGGGPGMGPIGVRAHLAPYLPSSASVMEGKDAVMISAAPYGSASVLPISAAYIMMMGRHGLRAASEMAILNANYIAGQLEGAYEILFRGARGFTAHECILDLRPFKKTAGVSVDDIAKRLVDYGFHAPTVSFPVAGTMMIEPTESESLSEIERFCEAMLAIRQEIAAIEAGDITLGQSPLVFAPHTAQELAGSWERVYNRQIAAFPPALKGEKYWPPVSRVDHAWGDRNLICSCPDMSAYETVG